MSKYAQAAAAEAARYQQADAAVKKFQEAAHAKWDGHSYACGFLGSKVAAMAAAYLTKAQFAEFLASMEQSTVKQTT